MWSVILVSVFFVSWLAVRGAIPLARMAGGLDVPDGHKQHKMPVPYVGGFGVLVAALGYASAAAFGLVEVAPAVLASLLLASLVIFLTGLADDRWQLSSRIRLVIEVGAASLMIAGAGVVLVDLGELIPHVPMVLGVLGVPVTLFAMLSVTNALNMIDGIDGLSGSLSFVSLGLLAVLAFVGGAENDFLLAACLAVGVLGFLFFNVRCCGRRNAQVYLGDNGSMLVGFLLGWLFIDLSQGPNAVMTPVTALYLFSIPLFDSAMAIARRVWMRRSPFQPDRYHLHHMLLGAGASVQLALVLLVSLHLAIGLVGLVGLYMQVPEWLMFDAYLGMFVVYGFVISRPWRFIPVMRRILVSFGFTLEQGTGVFVGRIDPAEIAVLLDEIHSVVPDLKSIHIYGESRSTGQTDAVFFIVHVGDWYGVRPTINRLRKKLSMDRALEIRQYVERSPDKDRRKTDKPANNEQRRRDRRGQVPVQEMTADWLNDSSPLPLSQSAA